MPILIYSIEANGDPVDAHVGPLGAIERSLADPHIFPSEVVLQGGETSNQNNENKRNKFYDESLLVLGVILCALGCVFLCKVWWSLSFNFSSNINAAGYVALVIICAMLMWCGLGLIGSVFTLFLSPLFMYKKLCIKYLFLPYSARLISVVSIILVYRAVLDKAQLGWLRSEHAKLCPMGGVDSVVVPDLSMQYAVGGVLHEVVVFSRWSG